MPKFITTNKAVPDQATVLYASDDYTFYRFDIIIWFL